MNIPIYKPELPPYQEVEPDIREMYESGMLYPGKFTERLISEIQEFCGVSFCLPVSSCSLGLILMLNTLPKGSTVIMPAFTFNATLQALEWNGLLPLVVDVDQNGQLRPDLVTDCLENYEYPYNVSAILGVHMWGNLLDTREFHKIAQSWPLRIFYDGAHALGSFDAPSIVPGDATCFSIAATKPISAGEGGLIVTNDAQIHEQFLDGAFHGLYGSLDTKVRGINGKIQEFNSILAYHALQNIDNTRQRRTELIEFYRDSFKDLPLRVWKTRSEVSSSSYKDCVVFTETHSVRESLDIFVQEHGIGTKRYFEPAIPDMGSFSGMIHSADTARKLSETCLTLPLYPALSDSEVEYIVGVVRKFFNS